MFRFYKFCCCVFLLSFISCGNNRNDQIKAKNEKIGLKNGLNKEVSINGNLESVKWKFVDGNVLEYVPEDFMFVTIDSALFSIKVPKLWETQKTNNWTHVSKSDTALNFSPVISFTFIETIEETDKIINEYKGGLKNNYNQFQLLGEYWNNEKTEYRIAYGFYKQGLNIGAIACCKFNAKGVLFVLTTTPVDKNGFLIYKPLFDEIIRTVKLK